MGSQTLRRSSSLFLVLVALVCNSQMSAVRAQGAPPSRAPYDDSQENISMTMYQVLNGENGQQYFLTNSKQSVMLPGAGVAGNSVAIYASPDGAQWYVDRTGTQQYFPGSGPSFASNGGGNMSDGPYGATDWQSGGTYYQQQQYASPPVAPSVQNNYYGNSNSSSSNSGGGGGVGAALGAAVGAGLGAAAGAAMSTIPWGTPVYWGGGSPWYSGAGGAPVYVNRDSFHQYNEWNRQNSTWNHNVNNHWSDHNFNNNNWDHHWGHNGWPGKDHGFPPPHDQTPGRLYSPNQGGGFAGRGFGGDRGFGGGGRGFGGGGRGGDGGRGFGGGGRGGNGGGRGGDAGGHHDGGGGHHDGGGGHHGGGGGHHGGGGGHHGGGGHGRR